MRANQAECGEAASNVHPFFPDASSHDTLIAHLQKTLAQSLQDLSEEDIWVLIAQNASSEWVAAQDALKKVQEKVDEMNSPENISLGLIGAALDSEERMPVMEAYYRLIAEFTLINEALKQREDLMQTFKTLAAQKKMLETSRAQTEKLREITEEMVTPTFSASAKKKKPRASLQNFRGIFSLTSKNPRKVILQTVPSSPEI